MPATWGRRSQALSIKQALNKLCAIMAADQRHRGRLLCISHCLCRERAGVFIWAMRRSISATTSPKGIPEEASLDKARAMWVSQYDVWGFFV